MMDNTFCNGKSPNPFKSSLAIYAFEPKAEDLPDDFCGDSITYLKISCTITGYQPTAEDKEQIVKLLEPTEVDYSKLYQITNEYFGCYGVLLNVSVHPYDAALKKDFDKYPRIIDFEPKTRDFYQAASETGEVLTASIGRITTGKSFGSTDSTQSSWQASANASISSEAMMALTGVPVGVGASGTTGQVRTETDQENWNTATDASRERREGQSTTTQLNQLYNLLTGYHAGSNRATFVMLPRPHILQPTDRRTFVQGLRLIEGIQDFFLVVVRPADQKEMQVDAHLQTGHFPENISVDPPAYEAKYDSLEFTVPIKDSVAGNDGGKWSLIGDVYEKKVMSKTRDVVDEANGWEADPTKGDSGHGGVQEIRNKSKVTITQIDTETGEVLGTYEQDVSEESGKISDVEYQITDGNLVVTATLKAKAPSPTALGPYQITTFSRLYKIFLRRAKLNSPTPVADNDGLLITQRSLCVEIEYRDCIRKIPPRNPFKDVGTLLDIPFDFDDLFAIPKLPRIEEEILKLDPNGPRFDFAFKKGLIRRIQQTMLTSGTSPLREGGAEVGYLQTRHFQRQLLRVLPARILDRPVGEVDFLAVDGLETLRVSLREFLGMKEVDLATKIRVSPRELRRMRHDVVRPRAHRRDGRDG